MEETSLTQSNMPTVCRSAVFVLASVLVISTSGVGGNSGREFIVGFLRQEKGKTYGKNTLYVTSSANTTVLLEVPFLDMRQTHHVTSSQAVTTIELDGIVRMTGVTGKERKGIRVTSDHDIALHGLNSVPYSADGFLALPSTMLGAEYIVPSYHPVSWMSLIGIVALEDNTHVRVSLRTIGSVTYKGKQYKNFDTIEEVLDKLEIFQVGSTSDLTGTVVKSNKKVSVFSGNECTYVPITNLACDHLVEQIPPVDHWGTYHVTLPTSNRTGGHVFRILSAYNKTEITVGGNSSSLDRGEFAEYDAESLNDTVEIKCDKPCLVVQYNKADEYDTYADPFMMIVPPVSAFTSAAILPTPLFAGDRQFKTFISILMKTSDTPGLLVDDQQQNLAWSIIPGTHFSRVIFCANKTVYSISHRSENATFLPLVSGYRYGESFGFPGCWTPPSTPGFCKPSMQRCPEDSEPISGPTIPRKQSCPCVTSETEDVEDPDVVMIAAGAAAAGVLALALVCAMRYGRATTHTQPR